MQISMNQGTGLSERNWLTEGCHLCAWKMMDPICKLLLHPTAPLPTPTNQPPPTSPSPPVVFLRQGRKNAVWWNWRRASHFAGLSKKPQRTGEVFDVDRIDYYHGLCFFILLSFCIVLSTDIDERESISITQKWRDKNSRFWRVGLPNLLFLVTTLRFVLHGGHTFRTNVTTNAMQSALLASWNLINACFLSRFFF